MTLKCTLAALAATSVAASAATVTTSYSTVSGPDDNNQAGPMWGQGITVNVGADTPDGSIPTTVYITELSFQYSSSNSGGLPGGYIHVYDNFATDGTGAITAIGNLVAVSNETTFGALTGGEQLTWTFDGTAGIDKSTTYYYISAIDTTAATVGSNGNLIGAGYELDVGNPYSGGQAYRGNGGQSDWDMAFELKTETVPVPEPSSAALLGLGGLALILRRRK